MARQVTWRLRAEQDLSEAFLYLGADSPSAAERLLETVENASRFLLDNPAAGRLREFRSPRASGIRSWVVPGFSTYLIFYRTNGEGIEIVRIIHSARDLPRLLEDEP